MPGKLGYSGLTTLFGVRLVFDADRKHVLDAALSRYRDGNGTTLGEEKLSIYVVIKSREVDALFVADAAHVHGSQLAITRDGFAARADGMAGLGACEYPDVRAARLPGRPHGK